MTPCRGEIWWAALDPTIGSEIAKTRPCVVMTRDLINQHRRTVVVIPLSSSPKASSPILIAVDCVGRCAVAVVDQIRAVAKERLQSRMGFLTQTEMDAIGEALQQVLELI
ncbi:MAG: type II toxin-antitoxin system PemK/MazF family toxin [Acidobacteriota bacterium]|nr:type II toxin-antitoxin system PemK/MazF family toxin [Acidobacteriota bacterium]